MKRVHLERDAGHSWCGLSQYTSMVLDAITTDPGATTCRRCLRSAAAFYRRGREPLPANIRAALDRHWQEDRKGAG